MISSKKEYITYVPLFQSKFKYVVYYKSGHDDGVIEGLEQGRSEGKLEGKLELITSFLSSRFTISDDLSKKLQMISNADALGNLLIAAAKAVSVEEFETELAKVLPDHVESTEKI